VLVLGTLYLVRRPLLRSVGEGWLVEDPLEKSDAIVVLSIDNFYAIARRERRRFTGRDSRRSLLQAE